jgi:hypothetical protein
MKKDKLDELCIRMRNYKTPKLVEGQSADYVVIHNARKGPSLYSPAVCTPSKRGHGPPCGIAATIVGECPTSVDDLQERR